MMTTRTLLPVLVSALMSIGAASRAEIHNFTISLDGAQAGVTTAATGSGSATLDDSTNLFSWMYTFSGLSGPATLTHFHGPAAPGSSAGVQVNVAAFGNINSPPVSGSTTISGPQATDLLNNLWYLNIHTSANGGGEIRGQVLVSRNIPEPTSAVLLLAGASGLLFVRRRMVQA